MSHADWEGWSPNEDTTYVLDVLADAHQANVLPEALMERIETAMDLLSGWCGNHAALMVVKRHPEEEK